MAPSQTRNCPNSFCWVASINMEIPAATSRIADAMSVSPTSHQEGLHPRQCAHMAQTLIAQADVFGAQKRYAEQLSLLEEVAALGDSTHTLREKLALCYQRLRKWREAEELYHQLREECQYESSAYHRCSVLLGTVHSALANYDTALQYWRAAFAHFNSTGDRAQVAAIGRLMETAQLRSTRAAYPQPKEGAYRVCGDCEQIGTNMIACSCLRAWYCDAACKHSAAAHHVHPVLPLDALPADVLRHHILPLCLLPAHTTHSWQEPQAYADAAKCGLSLRGINRRWRAYVGGYERFWLNVVPNHWNKEFKPTQWDGRGTNESVSSYVLEHCARRHYKHTLERKIKQKKATIKNNTKCIGTRVGYISGYKREIEEFEASTKQRGEEIEELEGKLKRVK